MKVDPSQVEIPKEDIDEIIKQFGCSKEEAVRAYLAAVENSDKVYDSTLGSILGPPENSEVPTVPVHIPADIKKHLDKYVIGQEDYKKRLSIAAGYHFAVVRALSNGAQTPSRVHRFRKKNTIISGPSGSGKTYCVEILGDLLEVPTLVIDATDYTEAGYVGKSADDMIRELIQLAPGRSKQEKADFIETNGGLIFVDEMDKKAKDGKMIGHDISREGFQRAVLKLIERKIISVDDPMSPASQIQDVMDQQRGMTPGQAKRKGTISTENILFILGGSFQRQDDNLEQIVKKRLDRGEGKYREDGTVTVTGFVAGNNKKEEKHYNYYKEANEDDYIRFGIIPELVGRAPVKTYVNALSKNDLIRIMKETEDSILEQYKFEFSLFGIELAFDDDALLWIAEKAENKKTGARALISVFEDVLTDMQYELPGTNFKELVVTRAICEAPHDAMLNMMARSPYVDFIEKFKRDHGIDISMSEQVEKNIEAYAKEHGIPVSTAIDKLLFGASALNYMDWKGVFEITEEAIDNPKYFDELFIKWRQTQVEDGKIDNNDKPVLP